MIDPCCVLVIGFVAYQLLDRWFDHRERLAEIQRSSREEGTDA